jgi:hypothetical protein
MSRRKKSNQEKSANQDSDDQQQATDHWQLTQQQGFTVLVAAVKIPGTPQRKQQQNGVSVDGRRKQPVTRVVGSQLIKQFWQQKIQASYGHEACHKGKVGNDQEAAKASALGVLFGHGDQGTGNREQGTGSGDT